MTKIEAYRFLDENGHGFVANVVANGYSNAAKKLKAMARLVKAGHVIYFAQFSLDVIMLDGRASSWDEIERWRPELWEH